MTSQLARQQDALLEANEKLDYRNRFIEAVLGGVSAGVIGLDGDGRIDLANRKAGDFLDERTKALRGRTLTEVMPEADELLAEARRRPRKLAERQRSEEHTSELQSLMRISYAVFCLKK